MKHCWNSPTELKECDKASCCYNAACLAVFDYWKFAHSKEWKEIVARELEKAKECGDRKEESARSSESS